MKKWILTLLVLAGFAAVIVPQFQARAGKTPGSRREIVFWHFWGGRDRAVVDDVVARFNRSQSTYWVRAVAVPGNNFDAKLFLSVVGKNPPDLINQDDPVLADWLDLGVLQPVDEFAGAELTRELDSFLLPAAKRLVQVDNRWAAVPNGLDVRAMYYSETLFEALEIEIPQTLDDLDAVVNWISPPENPLKHGTIAFLPDPRRIWTWGYVFGGTFFDEATRSVAVDSDAIVRATQWMAHFSRRYGSDFATRYRQTDQTLPGKIFPLLPFGDDDSVGRYAMVLDGQWRVRDIEEFTAERLHGGRTIPRFGVFSLPPPASGREKSGWINGNFFIVPRGVKEPEGATAFIRFWIGLDDPDEAARTCAAGGWIPVSRSVIDSPRMQAYLSEHPLMSPFVELASSENLFPYPATRGGMFFKRTVEAAAEEIVSYPDRSAPQILSAAAQRIKQQLDRLRNTEGERHD